jgi:hypothetical protein
MKSNSWTKEWLVIAHSDYDNTWSALTIALTFKQASAFINNARYLNRLEKSLVKLITVTDFANMQAICPPFPPATGAVPWTPKQIREYDQQQLNQLPQALL